MRGNNFIERSTQLVNGKTVDTLKTEFTRCCVTEFEVGTNGLHGGDTGHGGRSYLRIEDLGGTDITITPISHNNYSNEGVIIEIGGDDELENLIDGLEFAVESLKEMRSYYKGFNTSQYH